MIEVEELQSAIRETLIDSIAAISSAVPDLDPAKTEIDSAITSAAQRLATDLCNPDRVDEAANVLIGALYPKEPAPISFWNTDIGTHIAENSSLLDGVVWNNKEAAQWLGIATSTLRSLKSKKAMETDENNDLIALSVIAYGRGRAWRVVRD